MFALYMLSVFLIIASGYINVRRTNFERRMDVFNEVKVIIIMYHLMLFTDFLPDPNMQSQLGISCSVILVLGTIINMAMLFLQPIVKFK